MRRAPAGAKFVAPGGTDSLLVRFRLAGRAAPLTPIPSRSVLGAPARLHRGSSISSQPPRSPSPSRPSPSSGPLSDGSIAPGIATDFATQLKRGSTGRPDEKQGTDRTCAAHVRLRTILKAAGCANLLPCARPSSPHGMGVGETIELAPIDGKEYADHRKPNAQGKPHVAVDRFARGNASARRHVD